MQGSRLGRWTFVAILCAALAGCASPRPPGGAGAGSAAATIVGELEASADRWNAGDLQGFLRPYHDGAETTFVGSGGLLRGKAAIEARYRQSYWSGGAPENTLRFVDAEVRMLGPEHALLTGRYRLFSPAGAQTAEGPFSLVYARTADGWRIVHDHSS